LAEAEFVIEVEDDEELIASPSDSVGRRHGSQGSCKGLAGSMRSRGRDSRLEEARDARREKRELGSSFARRKRWFICGSGPRALPWAGMGCHVGAEEPSAEEQPRPAQSTHDLRSMIFNPRSAIYDLHPG
jgi:hypothetical protein